MKRGRILCLAALSILTMACPLPAAQFSRDAAVTWESISQDTAAYFSNLILGGYDEDGDGKLSDDECIHAPVYRTSTLAAALLGFTCGLLGSFVTLRRMALFGDMLGHAVLPGIAIGFIIAGTKSAPALLAGSVIAGLLAAGFTKLIRNWSRVKEDAALGISLSLFYALGIWLLSWITRHPELATESTGLNQYLFGNPAVIQSSDLDALIAAALVVTAVVWLGYKELLICTFDRSFSGSIGIHNGRIDTLLLILLTVVIVVTIKILGIILVAAMLVIPPSAAYLLTDRFRTLCILSAGIGIASSVLGLYASIVLHVGAGPAIVCSAFSFLMLTFFFSPWHGLTPRYLQHRRLSLRTGRENLLATAYRIREGRSTEAWDFTIAELAAERNETPSATQRLARAFRGSDWGRLDGDTLRISSTGSERARGVIRSHRLWELFLSREASLPADHVHSGAEEIEHFLDADTLAELERLLDDPSLDPHGRSIPGPPSSADEVAS